MALKRGQVGLYGPIYYGGFSPVLNWSKIATSPDVFRSVGGNLTSKQAWDAGTYFDTSTGELLSPVPANTTNIRYMFWNVVNSTMVALGCNYAGETFVCEFDGTATCTFVGGGTGAVQTSPTSNKQQIVFGSSPSNCYVDFALTNLNDPPRNIRIYQARYAQNVANGERWNPHWLAEISKVGTLRFMDMQYINSSDIADFSQLARFTYSRWFRSFGTGDQSLATSDGPKGSIHPEFICELATLTGCKVHVCFPAKATDAYVTSFVSYLYANCPTQVTYEYCNEAWHSGFRQYFYCEAKGAAVFGKAVTGITRGNPTTFQVPGHGLTTGQTADLYITAPGWEALYSQTYPNVVGTVTVIDANTFTAVPHTNFGGGNFGPDIDTTGFPAFSGSGSAIHTTATADSYTRWYGYRAAQIMKIVRDIYGPIGTTWKAIINTFSGGIAPAQVQIAGVEYYLSSTGSPLAVKDLFTEIDSAPYFGAGDYPTKTITAISKANPAVVTSAGHGYPNGRRLKIFATGMTQINDTFGTVANATANTFELAGVNSTAYTTFNYPTDSAYAANGELWDVMDESNTRFTNDAVNGNVNYPTKYTYYAQVMAQIAKTGSHPALSLYTSSLNIVAYAAYLSDLKAFAKTKGLGIGQYEGNYGFYGDPNLRANGAEIQFVQYLVGICNSPEMAATYDEFYRVCYSLGIDRPSKFVEAGPASQYGAWGGILYWPLAANGNTSHASNPVWRAVLKYADKVPTTYAVRFGA